MNRYRRLVDQFKNRGPLLNIVLDGYGSGPENETNAIFRAETPWMDHLLKKFPSTRLLTHGRHVGLPSDGDMGGSEVGHLTLGAGRILDQGSKLIGKMIESGRFKTLPLLNQLMRQAKDSSLHFIGLLSDGNVHSHVNHLEALILHAAESGVKKLRLHALLDGRDVPIQSALDYVERVEKLFAQLNGDNPGFDYRIASAGGRERITMDRAKNWEKVRLGWRTHVEGDSGNNFRTAAEAVRHFRKLTPGLVDQDLPPFNLIDPEGRTVRIEDGDVVFCFNFRGDRAIEISRAFAEEDFDEFAIPRRPRVTYAGMMVYDEDTDQPRNRLFTGPKVEDPFGKRILEMGLNQFRLAETQKFPHVTFFYNGGYRLPLDPAKEDYRLIESDAIESFATRPAMKAREIADCAAGLIESGEHGFGLINIANPDMVGHSGDMAATVKAVEVVDEALKKICECLRKHDGVAVVLADHGNADEMIVQNPKTGKTEPSAKHSLNPVPCVIFDPRFNGDYALRELVAGDENNLAMIAATNHVLLGRPAPDDLARPILDV